MFCRSRRIVETLQTVLSLAGKGAHDRTVHHSEVSCVESSLWLYSVKNGGKCTVNYDFDAYESIHWHVKL